jgi:phosphoadenosine phosphosulfate reductase
MAITKHNSRNKRSRRSADFDLNTVNRHMKNMTATQRINWSITNFGDGLYAMTSAGIDSALLLDHLAQTGYSVPVVHINTGFLPEETLAFRDTLETLYDLSIHEYGPSSKQIDDITERELWNTDLSTYSKLTKLDPLERAINDLQIEALLTAVRSDQTDNRATLEYIGYGNNGELRIRPFIDWPTEAVATYIDGHGLPRNALHAKGYESVADRQTTTAGHGRVGRSIMECGLHVQSGKPVKNTKNKS